MKNLEERLDKKIMKSLLPVLPSGLAFNHYFRWIENKKIDRKIIIMGAIGSELARDVLTFLPYYLTNHHPAISQGNIYSDRVNNTIFTLEYI